MTDRRKIILIWASIAAASFAWAGVCLAQAPGAAPTPRAPNPALAPPSEQAPMPKRIFDPSLSTGKPEDCVAGTIWSPSLRGCMPPWHVEPPAK